MNTQNETVASAEMMKQLRDAGLDRGYEPVPKEFLPDAEASLAGRQLADMSPELRRKLRNERKRKHREGVKGW